MRQVRSAGPGGQRVNKVATRVVLRFSIRRSRALSDAQKELLQRRLGRRLSREGELQVSASRHRETARNRAEALERLARLLQESLQTPTRRLPTRPSRGSKERRLEQKRLRGQVKRQRRERDSSGS